MRTAQLAFVIAITTVSVVPGYPSSNGLGREPWVLAHPSLRVSSRWIGGPPPVVTLGTTWNL